MAVVAQRVLVLHGVLVNPWNPFDPVLCAACALTWNVDFHRSQACISFVYAFAVFKTAQAAQSKFRKLSTLGYTTISTNRQIFFKNPMTGIA
jgi:hypothetical protein